MTTEEKRTKLVALRAIVRSLRYDIDELRKELRESDYDGENQGLEAVFSIRQKLGLQK
jgi:hypothetical protein